VPRRRLLHDEHFRKAKDAGYVARSVFKLKEINEKKGLIRRGDHVLDLGCAPGSWLQVASELVGPKGRVVGVDLQPVEIALPENVRALQADVFEVESAELLGDPPHLFDVVVSDMAPNTGGGPEDHFRSVDLCDRAMALLPCVLKAGGNLAMKVFEGEAYPDLLKRAGAMFQSVKGFKPKASRDVSREMYVVGKGFQSP